MVRYCYYNKTVIQLMTCYVLQSNVMERRRDCYTDVGHSGLHPAHLGLVDLQDNPSLQLQLHGHGEDGGRKGGLRRNSLTMCN